MRRPERIVPREEPEDDGSWMAALALLFMVVAVVQATAWFFMEAAGL